MSKVKQFVVDSRTTIQAFGISVIANLITPLIQNLMVEQIYNLLKWGMFLFAIILLVMLMFNYRKTVPTEIRDIITRRWINKMQNNSPTSQLYLNNHYFNLKQELMNELKDGELSSMSFKEIKTYVNLVLGVEYTSNEVI